jgi:hypothetical protein
MNIKSRLSNILFNLVMKRQVINERERLLCTEGTCEKVTQCVSQPEYSCIQNEEEEVCLGEESYCSQIEAKCVNSEAVCVYSIEICIQTDIDGKCVQTEQNCESFIQTCLDWQY